MGTGNQRMSQPGGPPMGLWTPSKETDSFKGETTWVGTSNPDCGLSPIPPNPEMGKSLPDSAFWDLPTQSSTGPASTEGGQ